MALAIAAPGGRGTRVRRCAPGSRSAASRRPRRLRWRSATAPTRWVWSGRCRAAPASSISMTARRIARAMPPPIATFLLSSATDPEELVAQSRQVTPTALQIVDAVEPGAYALLRRELPALKLVQVVHVTGEDTIAEALALATQVDALLLDSGSPDAPVRGAGRHRPRARLVDQPADRRGLARAGVPGRRPDAGQCGPRRSAPSARSGSTCAPACARRGSSTSSSSRRSCGRSPPHEHAQRRVATTSSNRSSSASVL